MVPDRNLTIPDESPYRLRLLGGVVLEDGGAPVEGRILEPRRLALLALLGASAENPLSREAAAARIWPESPPDRARHSLADALYVIRKTLGKEAVRASGDALRLDPGRVEVDVVAFREALGEEDLERAVGLYPGPFLDGFHLGGSVEFETWVSEEREHLARAHRRALSTLADRSMAEEDPASAVRWLRELVRADPYDDDAARRLVEGLVEIGRKVEALQLGRAHLRRLRDELGVEPDPDLAALLQRLGGLPVTIAVLPFEPPGETTVDLAFSDGLTEELIHRLSAIPDLRVISRTSAMAYRDTEKTLPEIARELGVDAVVEGTARRTEDRIRVMASLVDARRDRTLWSGQYRREQASLFEIQSDLALRIARALETNLSDDQRERVAKPATRSIEAYNLWLLGRYHQARWTPENSEIALRSFGAALEADPGFAEARLGIANALQMQGMLVEPIASDELFPRTLEHVRVVMESDPHLPGAHALFGMAQALYEWDYEAAGESFREALRLNPSSVRARMWYALFYLTMLGRHEEAMEEARRFAALDPLSPFVQLNAGACFHWARRWEEAMPYYECALELFPGYWFVLQLIGQRHLWTGEPEKAVPILEDSVSRAGPALDPLADLGCALALCGEEEAAREILLRLEEAAGTRYVSPYYGVIVHLGLGEPERVFDGLDEAVELRDWRVVWTTFNPLFDPLWTHPRFQSFLAAIHLPDRRPAEVEVDEDVRPSTRGSRSG